MTACVAELRTLPLSISTDDCYDAAAMDPDRTTRLICPLISTDAAAMRADMNAAAAAGADTAECRLDYLPASPTDAELALLLTDPPLDVIVTVRPQREGGHFQGSEDERLDLLARAAPFAPAYLDVELDTPPGRRPRGRSILSHHNFESCPANLDEIASRLDASDAAVSKVAFAAAGPEDALRAFDVIRASDKPALALAMGEAGIISRLLAKKFGAFGTFAALAHGAESAPGQPTVEELKSLYRWDAIGPATQVFGVIGCPVGHSMSPAIHNAAFAAADMDGVYVPLLIQPGADNFNRFMDALLERAWMDWRGLSVTIPHKEHALAYVGAATCDELAVRIGAVNTITIGPDGQLRGDNTDYAAAIDALCGAMGIAREDLAGRTVAVLGAGGAGRAIVAALAHYGAETTIYNRTVSRGEQLAEEFGCRAAGRDALATLDAEVVINCTPIGMHPNTDASPLDAIPSCAHVVFDTIYNPVETLLLRRAADAGCTIVTGVDMFVNQAVAQFEIWTGAPAPRDVMRGVVVRKLSS